MRLNFRKIAAIASSVLMLGMTAGVAAAANYPAPFVVGGSPNVAIVYGSGAAFSDQTAASSIATSLSGFVTGSGGTISGGDSVLLERSSDRLNLGDSASTVFVTSVDEDDLPNLLAEGTYSDDSNNEFDYTQKVTLGSNLGLEHFADSDYNNEVPTVGIRLADGEHVLNYTFDFTTHPAFNATVMETTTLKLMGKNYYVLDVTGMGDGGSSNKTTLLDTASSGIVAEGASTVVNGKTVSIEFISSTEAILNVDGETTNTLNEGETFKLDDGTYVGVKDILFDSRDGAISKVEVSVGTGKLEITDGSTIELNDETIEEIVGYLTQDSSYKLDKIVLQWTVDDEAFITQSSDLLMPGFSALKLSFGGFTVPSAESTKLEASGSDVLRLSTTIKDGAASIDLLGANSTGQFATIGKDSSNRLVTSKNTWVFINQTAGDKYAVASWNSTTEAESYYLEITVTTEDNINKLEIQNKVTGDSKKIANGSDASFGSVVLTLNNLTRDGSKKWANISINSGGSFHELYTAEGMKVFLPYFIGATLDSAEGALNYTNNANSSSPTVFVKDGIYNGTITDIAGHGFVSYYQWFDEEDKDGNLAGGDTFNATVTESGTSDKIHVSAVDTSSPVSAEIGDTDVFEEYALSDLATKTLYDTGGDQDWVTITYAGDQSYGQLYLAAPETTVSGGTGALGDVLVTDSEVSSVGSKNLVVVGGSCINSAAAALVGGAYCGSAWASATGVGAGQFLIKGYSSSSITTKMALLVAGYEAADTTNAATYLRTQSVDTSKAYKGTSGTQASLIVA